MKEVTIKYGKYGTNGALVNYQISNITARLCRLIQSIGPVCRYQSSHAIYVYNLPDNDTAYIDISDPYKFKFYNSSNNLVIELPYKDMDMIVNSLSRYYRIGSNYNG